MHVCESVLTPGDYMDKLHLFWNNAVVLEALSEVIYCCFYLVVFTSYDWERMTDPELASNPTLAP